MGAARSHYSPSKSRRLPGRTGTLSERRGVYLAIIPISYQAWNKVYDCNAELELVFEEDEKKPKHDEEQPSLPASSTTSLLEESHIVRIKKGLYIAVVDDEDVVPSLINHDDEPFTHVVQLSYKTPYGSNPPSEAHWRREEAPRTALVQRLQLICPSDYLFLSPEQTAVGYSELHAARDFLSLALPYGSDKWWPEDSELRADDVVDEQGERDGPSSERERDNEEEDENAQVAYLARDIGIGEYELLGENSDREQEEEVNVVIVAPTCRAVDVLSILLCYLSFLKDASTDLISKMEYFDDDVWDSVTLERWSMMYVELIARGEWFVE